MAPSIEEAWAALAPELVSTQERARALAHAVLAEAYEKTDMAGLAVARIKARIDSLGKEGK